MNAYQTVFCYILNTIMLLEFDNIPYRFKIEVH